MDSMNRRDALRVAGLGAAGLALGLSASPGLGAAARGRVPSTPSAPPRTLRLAHLSDIHVQPELRGDAGLAACLKHVSSLKDRPDLVITGGDLIFDGFAQEHARTQALWDLYTRVFKDSCGIEVQHTLGNHDIWGWHKSKSKTTGDEARWGKRWFCEIAGRDKTYQVLDRGRWRIIQLDSVHTDPRNPDGYIGKLDEEQMAWLESQIRSTAEDRHVAIVSHIPILSLCALVFDGNAKQKELRWEVSAGNMHIDGARLHRLFRDTRRVKLCLSGHIHKLDKVEMDGVTYICNGAVSGAWWKGRKDRCDEGYGVVDLFDDGSFQNTYATYGWKAEE
jgi:3',5'-cyclic-AMP phosphodiesterase